MYKKVSFWFPFSIVFFEIATYLANDMYLPGLPTLMEDFQITQWEAQDTLLYWFLGSASMQLLVGPISDRFGRKIILLLGAVAYILSSFVCAFTHDFTIFLIARFIQGCTVCSVVVAGYAAVHEQFESTIAIKIVSIMGSIVIIAPAFGPILGAGVIEFSTWRVIFYLLGACGILSFILLAKAVPQTQTQKHALEIKGILKDYFQIASRKKFLEFTLPFCFMFLSLICWIVQSPFLIIEQYQKTSLDYGMIQLYIFGIFIVGAQVTGRLVYQWDPIKIVRVGLGIGLLGSLGFVLFSVLGYALWVVVLFMMVCAFGFAMTFGPLSRLAIEACHEPMGRRMAIFSSYMSFFGVIATLLVSAFENNSMSTLAILVAGGTILACIVFLFNKNSPVQDCFSK